MNMLCTMSFGACASWHSVKSGKIIPKNEAKFTYIGLATLDIKNVRVLVSSPKAIISKLHFINYSIPF
jgi:hypothetical protein